MEIFSHMTILTGYLNKRIKIAIRAIPLERNTKTKKDYNLLDAW